MLDLLLASTMFQFRVPPSGCGDDLICSQLVEQCKNPPDDKTLWECPGEHKWLSRNGFDEIVPLGDD
eukprot:g22808.t1